MPRAKENLQVPPTLDDWDKETFSTDCEDMYLRLGGVQGRIILHLILAGIVSANPDGHQDKNETRLRKIEHLLFGNWYQKGDALEDEEVLIWMYRELLAARQKFLKEMGRTKTVPGGIQKIADAAVKRFRPDLIQGGKEFEIVSRRYKEAFSAQRAVLRNRYSDILDFGQENKIVAALLLKVLAVAGLRVDLKPVELSLLAVSEEEQAEFERELTSTDKE